MMAPAAPGAGGAEPAGQSRAADARSGGGGRSGRGARIAWGAAVAGLALAAWSTWDARRIAEIAGRHELVARRAASTADQLTERLDAASSQRAVEVERLHGEIRRLEGQLDRSLMHNRSLGEVLTAEAEERERAAVLRASEQARMFVPVPLGVRRCIETMRRCLDAEGYQDLRLLRASAIDNFELHDVEFLDVERGSPAAELVVAARMTMTLDRAKGRLLLRFRDGARRAHGVRRELPDEGFELQLTVAEGRMWEAQLPYIVRASGVYPESARQARRRPTLDNVTRIQWIERLDLLLARAGTDVQLRVSGFLGLEGGIFRDVRVLGYDRGKLLSLHADCAQMAIEIDERAGVVSLLLRDGTLRRDGTESTIGEQGYRMLLPDVTPEQATALMLGMVARK